MMRKISAMLAALLFAATTFAPVAEARDGRRDGYSRHYDRDHDRGRRHWRRDNDGDEAAAAVVGLVLGLAIGSLASQPSQTRRAQCYDNYQRCAAPPPRDDDYYRRDGSYEDRGGAYEREYGLEGGDGYYEDERPPCIRRERQWDRYANRYVTVDMPC